MKLELFEKARELGEMLIATDEYRKVQQAESAFNEDELAQAKVGEFNQLQKAVQEMMQTPDPDQAAIAAMADRLRGMQAELTEMPSIKEMNDAQTAFSNLLTQINQVLRFIITGEVEDGGCGGNCSSCGGGCGGAEGDGCGCGSCHE
jgi:cell fate (sporulation/competence/biofilm development) regulator YlbF (YheA/YmcA/DUF963 family)